MDKEGAGGDESNPPRIGRYVIERFKDVLRACVRACVRRSKMADKADGSPDGTRARRVIAIGLIARLEKVGEGGGRGSGRLSADGAEKLRTGC